MRLPTGQYPAAPSPTRAVSRPGTRRSGRATNQDHTRFAWTSKTASMGRAHDCAVVRPLLVRCHQKKTREGKKRGTDDGGGESEWFPDAVVPKSVHDRSTSGKHELIALALGLDILPVGLFVLVRALPPTRDEFFQRPLPPINVCMVGRGVRMSLP